MIQLAGALAGFLTLPILVHALGSAAFGVLVVVVSLAPWLTLVDGALYPTTRLLVGESRVRGDQHVAPAGLLRSAFRLALKIAAMNVVTLVMAVIVLPLVALFGSQGVADREQLVAAVLLFSLPVILSGPGGIYLGALEGVGRTVAAAIFSGLGPLISLPATILVVAGGGGLALLCAVQGLAVAVPRLTAWVYWHLRPSIGECTAEIPAAGVSLRLVTHMIMLSAAVLVQTGLDPVIVSSQLGSTAAGSFGLASRIVNGSLIPLMVLNPLFGANIAAARGSGWSTRRDAELRHLVMLAAWAGTFIGVCVLILGPMAAQLLGAGQVEAPLSLYAAGAAYVLVTFISTPLYLGFSGPQGLARSVRLNLVLVVCNVTASFTLVHLIGPAGPMLASALAGFVAIVYWLLMWRRHPSWLAEVHLATADPIAGASRPDRACDGSSE